MNIHKDHIRLPIAKKCYSEIRRYDVCKDTVSKAQPHHLKTTNSYHIIEWIYLWREISNAGGHLHYIGGSIFMQHMTKHVVCVKYVGVGSGNDQ